MGDLVRAALDPAEALFAARVDALRDGPGLAALLHERHPLYGGRGSAAVARMRGFALLAFERVGLPEGALPLALEELQSGRHAYLVGAAARALRGARPSSAFVPYLLKAFANLRQHDDALALGGYGDTATGAPASTTARREVLAALAWLGPHARAALSALAEWRADPHGELPRALKDEIGRVIAAVERAEAAPAPVADDDCCAWPALLGGRRDHAARRDAAALDALELEDHDGRRLTFGQFFRGRPAVVAFFYTRCDNPDKCSLTIAKLARVQQRLADAGLAGRVRLAALTYDPGFDLPPRLRAYALARGLRLDDDHRLLRPTQGLGPLVEHFELGVGFVGSRVNRHRLELHVLDRQARVAASFERLQWDEGDVVAAARALLDERPASEPAPTPSRTLAAWLPPILLACVPKCPACWAAYLSLLGVAGLERLPHLPWLAAVGVTLVALNLLSLGLRAWRTRRPLPLVLATLGSLALAAGWALGVPYARGAGLALGLAGALSGARGVARPPSA